MAYPNFTAQDLHDLAVAMLGEARGESDVGQRAVAHVIDNRANLMGVSISDAIRQPAQFSFIDDQNLAAAQTAAEQNSPAYQNALSIAQQVLSGQSMDPTGGATFYHTNDISKKTDKIYDKLQTIGNQTFYGGAIAAKDLLHMAPGKQRDLRPELTIPPTSPALTMVAPPDQLAQTLPGEAPPQNLDPSQVGITSPGEQMALAAPPAPTPGQSYTVAPQAHMQGVDPRLVDIMQQGAAAYVAANPGQSVEVISGKDARATGTTNHPSGRAMDIAIYDSNGNKLDNTANPQTFRAYEQVAQAARQAQLQSYPELSDKLRYGGYFQQGTAYDQMHMDISGGTTAYGDWEHGLNEAGRKNLPGVESVGMGKAAFAYSPDFTPFAQTASTDPAFMPSETLGAPEPAGAPPPGMGDQGGLFGAPTPLPGDGTQTAMFHPSYVDPARERHAGDTFPLPNTDGSIPVTPIPGATPLPLGDIPAGVRNVSSIQPYTGTAPQSSLPTLEQSRALISPPSEFAMETNRAQGLSGLPATPPAPIPAGDPNAIVEPGTGYQHFAPEVPNQGFTGQQLIDLMSGKLGAAPQVSTGLTIPSPPPAPIPATGMTAPSAPVPMAATGVTGPSAPPPVAATGMTGPEPLGLQGQAVANGGAPVAQDAPLLQDTLGWDSRMYAPTMQEAWQAGAAPNPALPPAPTPDATGIAPVSYAPGRINPPLDAASQAALAVSPPPAPPAPPDDSKVPPPTNAADQAALANFTAPLPQPRPDGTLPVAVQVGPGYIDVTTTPDPNIAATATIDIPAPVPQQGDAAALPPAPVPSAAATGSIDLPAPIPQVDTTAGVAPTASADTGTIPQSYFSGKAADDLGVGLPPAPMPDQQAAFTPDSLLSAPDRIAGAFPSSPPAPMPMALAPTPVPTTDFSAMPGGTDQTLAYGSSPLPPAPMPGGLAPIDPSLSLQSTWNAPTPLMQTASADGSFMPSPPPLAAPPPESLGATAPVPHSMTPPSAYGDGPPAPMPGAPTPTPDSLTINPPAPTPPASVTPPPDQGGGWSFKGALQSGEDKVKQATESLKQTIISGLKSNILSGPVDHAMGASGASSGAFNPANMWSDFNSRFGSDNQVNIARMSFLAGQAAANGGLPPAPIPGGNPLGSPLGGMGGGYPGGGNPPTNTPGYDPDRPTGGAYNPNA